MDNQNNLKLKPKDIQYLYNGILYFKPHLLNKTLTKSQYDSLSKIYGQLKEDFFFGLVFMLTSSVSAEEAAKKIEGWEHLAEEGKEVSPLTPLEESDVYKIHELTDLANQSPSDYQKALEKNTEEIKKTIEKIKERQKKMDASQLKPQVNKVYLEPSEPEEKIKLSEDQKEIIKRIHQDPKKFRDNLIKRIIANSEKGISTKQTKDSAALVANIFINKALNVSPDAETVTIDNSVFNFYTAFADPNSENVKKIFPNSEQAFYFSKIVQVSAQQEAEDAAKAAETVSKALNTNFSSFFIPLKIHDVDVNIEKTEASSTSVDVNNLITEINNTYNLREKIINQIRKKNPEVFRELTKAQRLKIEQEAQKIAEKQVSAKRAFKFLRFGKQKKLPEKKPFGISKFSFSTDWLMTEWSQMDIPQLSWGTSNIMLPEIVSSNYVFTSPFTNIVFDNVISRIPQVEKLNTIITGFRSKIGSAVSKVVVKIGKKLTAKLVATKLGGKIATIIGEQILPGIGTVLGIIQAISSIKDVASIVKVWLKKNEDKIPYIIGGLFLGGFILTGSPVLMVVSIGSFTVGGASAIAGGMGSLFFAFSNIIVGSILVPILIILIAIPVLVALILFIINSGAYMVPPGISPSEVGFPLPTSGTNIVCSDEKGEIVNIPNNTSSEAISKRSWEIVRDLYQGFWCFWNRSPGDFKGDVTLYPPSYPNLFNENFFASNPNPSIEEVQECGNCMFWCTYLVQKAYRENGNNILVTLWSPTMQADFEDRGKFKSSSEATSSNIPPGSVVFFRVGSSSRTDHVAIVYSIDQDNILYVQSNAGAKSSSLTFNKSGVGIQNLPGITVVGFGTP